MTWKEKDVMKLREEFVMRAMRQDLPIIDLCREYKISAKTGYKWIGRFKEFGRKGLYDKSRRPKRRKTEIPEDSICEIIRYKRAHNKWGSRKIRELFKRNHPNRTLPSVSSFHRILEKAGFVKKRRCRKRRTGERIENRCTPKGPNDLWTVDFKGWWYTPDGERCEPFTVRDEYSRFVLAISVLEDGSMESVKREFERIFRIYGLPRAIRSDNGSPFGVWNAPLGLSRLSVWWLALGIELDRIRPGHPEENGGHERLHRDIRMELEGQIQGNLSSHQAAFDLWRKEFNSERPHEALGMKTPSEVYRKSERTYEDPGEIEYGPGYIRRRVTQDGTIKVMMRKVAISRVFAGYDIGMKVIGEDRFEVWFDNLFLGILDIELETFETIQGG